LILGCAHIPKEAAYLSEELTGMIREAEASHLELLDKYMEFKHQEVDSFLASVWAPRFMETGIKDANLWSLISAESDPTKKAALLQEFTADAGDVVFRRRASLHDALDKMGEALRQTIQNHYSQMLIVNQSLTAHLGSAAKITETRERLLEQLKVPIEGMFDLSTLNGRIEEVMGIASKLGDEATLKAELAKIVEGFTKDQNREK
jgi:hypothetical protein